MHGIKGTVIVLLLIISSGANAEQALTGKVIQKWLDSFEPIQSWADKQPGLQDDLTHSPDDALSVDAMVAQLKAANLYDEAKDVIRDNGFDSPEQWLGVQIRIIKAMMSLQMEKDGTDFDVLGQIEKIKNNPSITEEQKKLMLNMMQSSVKMMEKISDAPPADKIAIQPYLPQIMKKLDIDGKR